MAETTTPFDIRARRGPAAIGTVVVWALGAALALVVVAELVFFGIHTAHLLTYPYPLDYGEGPLLAQVSLLHDGTPIWRLYSDPGAPPYAVVNYPPVYHLLAALVALPLGAHAGATLLAGRLVSLAATFAAVLALWLLSDDRTGTIYRAATTYRAATNDEGAQLWLLRTSSFVLRLLIILAFLGLPIVREWTVLMRVDMLGLTLGLWGLLIVRSNIGRRRVFWAALPLALSLFVKPSLIAAPGAALVWLLFRDWRRALLLGLLIVAGSGLLFVLLQIASGGWFAIHILAANANDWQYELAHGFWRDQMLILWPLIAAAALGTLAQLSTTKWAQYSVSRRPTTAVLDARSSLLPLYYTLFGAIIAFGIGKVGAYTNYFLEFYAGLIWLAASAIRPTTERARYIVPRRPTTDDRRPTTYRSRFSVLGSWFLVLCRVPSEWSSILVPLLVIGALLRYYPLWSETYLKPYGLIEKANPPRVAFGQYGVWRDLARERDILATLGSINAALVGDVRAAGAPIFTDVPGVAAQAGQLARLQAFEHRQLLDAGRWDQRPLLRDLANGRVPLVVLDYLGNWLTPEMIALITHRYAQDGSRGTYDIYRPVDPGPPATADLAFPDGPRLVGYHLALSAGRPIYGGGETVLLTLDWRLDPPNRGTASYEVVAQLTNEQGSVLLETTRPLLYGVLPPADWGDEVVQHLQPITLPPELPAMTYHLAVTLRASGRDLAPTRTIAPIVVAEQGGRVLGEGRAESTHPYFVPAPLLDAWRQLGGYDGPGDPLMPAAPFDGYTVQCFVRACLRLDGDVVQRLPLGELVHLGDAGLPAAPLAAGDEQRFPETSLSLRGPFLGYWRANGGMDAFGPPITGELVRSDRIVQYTRYARLERPLGGGAVRTGRLGEEFLRLPGGGAYRWP